MFPWVLVTGEVLWAAGLGGRSAAKCSRQRRLMCELLHPRELQFGGASSVQMTSRGMAIDQRFIGHNSGLSETGSIGLNRDI